MSETSIVVRAQKKLKSAKVVRIENGRAIIGVVFRDVVPKFNGKVLVIIKEGRKCDL